MWKASRRITSSLVLGILFCASSIGQTDKQGSADVPKVHDPRLEVKLFAANPDIVHPVAVDFDAKGRLLVIESHTHFAPKDYKGPKHDRIRVLEDTDGDGKADRFTTFFEGTRATMDLAVHPDGSVYVATRNEVLRLRDTDGDGKADRSERLVFLDTKGDYPHNGLSGLCFDARGDLYFGMGENLGASYKLIGSDGTTLTGEGEGGNILWCTADGKKLRRVATGFWNPFGVCRDIFGRMFAVDNDPDAMPPCRLLHVVEGGDYGYQFRYGRSGRHVFQAWDGQLPGTLPMVCGTGEAPCEVLSYESDGLPREYLGNLLVASWADHRVERYALKERGASFSAERQPFVQGGQNFRPVGMAVAPDGSVFVSDWVLKDYNLHGRGAIWHIRPREAKKPERPTDSRKALASLHRPLRESAAKRLVAEGTNREFLQQQLKDADVRVRAAILTALLASGESRPEALVYLAERGFDLGLRALAARGLAEHDINMRPSLENAPLQLQMEAALSRGPYPYLLWPEPLDHADPFMRHAAIQQLAREPKRWAATLDARKVFDPRRRVGVLLALRASGAPEGVRLLPTFLADPDEEVRFLAVKWIADQKLAEFRPQLLAALKNGSPNVRLYAAYATALARVDGHEVSDARLADWFLAGVVDEKASPQQRLQALRQIPASHKGLTVELLTKLLVQDDPALQRETVRALNEHSNPKRHALLLKMVHDTTRAVQLRAEALVGLSDQAEHHRDYLIELAEKSGAILSAEAVRALVGTTLDKIQRERLTNVARKKPELADLAARSVGQPFFKDRPPPKELDLWLKRLEGPADVDSGRRVFAHPKLASCFRCHRAEGRGSEVGPDLSTIGRVERGRILESLIHPSAQIAPHYQAWILATTDGKLRTGMLIRTYLDEYTYLDEKGQQFKLNTGDIVESRPAPTSIMPAGLVDLLTDQELRDLMAYLGSLR